MGKLRIGVAVITLMALLAGAAPAGAAFTWTGVTCSGINDLQSVLGAANPGDTIQLLSSDDCVGLAYSFQPGHVPVTLDGNGATLDGTGIVPTGTLPILSGADIQGTTIKNLTFVNGSLTSGDGAAIDLTGNSYPTLNNDQFYANTDTSFSGIGGAVAIKTSMSTGTITVENSTFGSVAQPNGSGWVGGGLAIRGAGPGNATPAVVISHDRFIGNTASDAGAGINFLPYGSTANIVVSNSTFSQNSNRYAGAGADMDFEAASPGTHPQVTVTGNTFTGNTDKTDSDASGAGLDVFSNLGGGSLTQVGNTFSANRITKIASGVSTDMGAGEFASGLPLTSIRDRFVGNAIVGSNPGDTTRGGGLVVCNSAPTATAGTIIDGVIAGNAISGPAPGQGAGAWTGSCYGGKAQSLVLRDSTISGNALIAGSSGGLYGDLTATLSASDSIIAGRLSGTTDLAGFAIRTIDHSDVCMPGVPPGTGNICADPKLLNASHGDVHETAASPTIDRGLNSEVPAGLTTDVYGAARITDGLGTGHAIVDMGAAESAAVKPKPPPKKVHCVVPKLKGLSLKAARHALSKAHCALGKVRRPKHVKRHQKLVVVAQSRKAHTRLARGTKIGVRLGPPPKRRRR
jgi:hypothetical protein